MKKIKYIALGVFATLLSSCGNDWLDLQSSTAIETDGSLTELRDFEFVLNGAYSSMQSSSYYGADMFCYGDLRGDDMKSYKSSSTNVSFYTFKYNKTNGPSGFRSNDFICFNKAAISSLVGYFAPSFSGPASKTT